MRRAKIAPLDSSLDNKSKTLSQKNPQNKQKPLAPGLRAARDRARTEGEDREQIAGSSEGQAGLAGVWVPGNEVGSLYSALLTFFSDGSAINIPATVGTSTS